MLKLIKFEEFLTFYLEGLFYKHIPNTHDALFMWLVSSTQE